jgi:O-antigen/teichoic acid export membrane protein
VASVPVERSAAGARRPLGPGLVLVGNAGRAVAQWVLVWMFALGGGAGAVGEYSYALAVATPVFLFLQLGLRNVYLTWTARPPFTLFLDLRVLCSLAAAAVVLGSSAFPWGPVLAVAAPVAVFKVADAVLDIFLGRLQEAQRLHRLAGVMTVGAVVQVLAAVAAYVVTGDVAAALWAAALGPLVATGAAGVTRADVARRGVTRTDGRDSLRRLVVTAAPLGLTDLLTALLTYVPVLTLGLSASAVSVGLFTAATTFVTLAFLVLSGVQMAVLGSFAAQIRRDGAAAVIGRAARLTGWWSAASFVAAVLVMLVGPDVLGWLYGAEFAIPVDQLWPVAATVALSPLLTVSGLVLMTLSAYRLQLVGALASVMVMVVLAVLAVAADGLGVREAGLLLLAGTAARILASLAGLGAAIRSRNFASKA